jgi:hypothetical protein
VPPLEQWGRFLPVPTAVTALLDRLLHHAVVVVTEGDSFRLREARARGDGRLSRDWAYPSRRSVHTPQHTR